VPLIDTHVHTRRYSLCAVQSMEDAIEAARGAGLDGFCITEHHHRWDEAEIAEAQRAGGGEDLIILPGQEITCVGPEGQPQGDYLVFGCPQTLPARCPVQDIIEAAHADGGLVIAAHPLRRGMGAGDLVYELPGLDGIEVYNQNHSPEDCERIAGMADALGLIPTAGSDAHAPGQVGQFAMNISGPVRSERDFVEALRRREFELYAHPSRTFRWAAG
jgi:hypothetical protein